MVQRGRRVPAPNLSREITSRRNVALRHAPPPEGRDEDLKQAVLAGLEQTFDKERWFKPVRESVHGLTAAQAAWHSAPQRHSVWQMVHHLTHYCRLAILRLDGAPIPEN